MMLPISWSGVWEENSPWAISISVDLQGCDPATLGNPDGIQDFVLQLCDSFGMERIGDCRVVAGDEDDQAYSMTQTIKRHLISGYFSKAGQRAYIDIISSHYCEPRDMAQFASAFFKAEHYKLQTALRQ
jgi:hypothetical protein